MSLLTLAEARNHIESDLIDAAMQQLIDDAEAEILVSIGAQASQIDEIINDEPAPDVIWLSRKASSLTTITEEIDGTVTPLLPADYRLIRGGLAVKRLDTGTHPGTVWGEIITVTYVPVDDTPRRKRVTVDLVKLALAYNGVKTESIGPYSQTREDYEAERSKLIMRLCSTWMA